VVVVPVAAVRAAITVVVAVGVLIHIETAYMAVLAVLAPSELSIPETHVLSHQQTQVICNAVIYTNP
jgi:hypothetical protein